MVRRILARELLTRWDLNHPLLEAYRSQAVCIVNSFRAEIGQRRAFMELLSDDSVTGHLAAAADRKLLKQDGALDVRCIGAQGDARWQAD